MQPNISRHESAAKCNNGFTIIEIIIVISVIGILTTIYIAYSMRDMVRARDAERAADVAGIARLFERYYIEKPDQRGASYPRRQLIHNGDYLRDIITDRSLVTAPDKKSPSLEATNSRDVPQSPGLDEYTYQVFDNIGHICNSASRPCVSYKLYYRKEIDNSVVTIDSLRQQ